MSEARRPVKSALARFGHPLLGLGLFALYLPTLARGVTFNDGPEILTGIATLGVIHPTGYPIFTVVAHAFMRLCAIPILPCLKVEIFNALCAATAAILTARAARDLATLSDRGAAPGAPPSRAAEIGGIAAGALLGLSPLLWEQVRIPEVYPFHVLLVAWAVYLWVRFEVTRRHVYVVAAALPMGIGLAHHVTMVYMLPAALLYLLARDPAFFVRWLLWPVARAVRRFRPTFLARVDLKGAWAFPLACLVGFLPLLSYLYLIWANAHTDGVAWGDVHDWDSLYAHMTGRQYQRFLAGKEMLSYWGRIKRIPGLFDAQFLPTGTALFFIGLAVTLRRAPRLALFLLAYLAFNVGHAVYYSVGDYANYYLPAVVVCAVILGAGLAWLLRQALARGEAARLRLCLGAAFTLFAGAAITIACYARFTKRIPAAIAGHVYVSTVLPLGLLALAALVALVVAWVKPTLRRRPIGARALPAVLLAGLVLATAPAAIARAHELGHRSVIGESYGAEVAENIPRGAVFLTQGDGYLFTMWYEHHVLGRGVDFATLDMGNLRTPWYQRYVRAHYPNDCDPLAPGNASDSKAWAAKCATFRQRVALQQKEPWVSLGLRGFARGKAAESPAPWAERVLRGADARCADEAFRRAHARVECRCFGYEKGQGALGEDCVPSADEGGVVPREALEIHAQRIVEDHIDERPVFERNTFTHWTGSATNNPRGWDGPTYQRISADYALVSRGRFNQIVYWDDIKATQPCGERLDPIRLRPLLPRARTVRGSSRRRAYRPNDFPTLMTASYLVPLGSGGDDEASRVFTRADEVYVRFDWFERYAYDRERLNRRGAAIRHGIRICAYEPSGRRVAVATTVSGKRGAVKLLAADAEAPLGTWTVQACSVGEVGDGPVSDDRACQRILLEYPFERR